MDKELKGKKIVEYLKEQGKPTIDYNTNLFLEGIIDSIEMLDLIYYIEHEFKVTIIQEYLTANNFESVESILLMLEKIESDKN